MQQGSSSLRNVQAGYENRDAMFSGARTGALPSANDNALNEESGLHRQIGIRIATHLPARIEYEESRRACKVIELSTTGCVIKGSGFLPKGSVVRLAMVVPSLRRRLMIPARAVRIWNGMQAFEFLSLRDIHRLTIAETIDALSRAS